jgi:hypothetical protein
MLGAKHVPSSGDFVVKAERAAGSSTRASLARLGAVEEMGGPI